MTGERRRQEIIAALTEADAALNATRLAERFGVTRQIIVADVALLRAAGYGIRAEHRGYVLDKPNGEIRKKIVCHHTKDGVLDEFFAIVDNGGRVLDVQVEHSIYGVISADMSIASRYDAEEFVRLVSETGATQLSDLTGGVHVHTVSVKDEATFARICARLTELGILIED
ncbi:MAG: transcription repressor NadR [Clostridia bacterium]|nr:transcription repressor NadR [Clostridia bacterium]